MKKILSLLLMLTLMLSASAVSVFAGDESHVHNWTEWTTEKESTCEEHGSEYRYCDVCEQYEHRELPLGPHDWSAWKTDEASTPYKKGVKSRYCIVCEKEEIKSVAKKKLTANQKKAVKAVETYLKAAKSYNVKKMDACFKKGSKNYGYPTEKINWIYKKYNKKIKWSMVDVKGKGSTITVKVKVTRPDFYKQAYNAYYETFDWAMDHLNASSSKLGNKILGKYNTKVKNCTKKTSTDTVAFTIVKSGKKWKIKAKTRTIVDIATAFLWKGSEDATDDFLDKFS